MQDLEANMNEIPAAVPEQGRLHYLLHNRNVGATALLAVLLVGLYFFAWREMRFFLVPSNSMQPTLFPNDMIVTLNQPFYRRGDIVVWREAGEYTVKRIVGLPGDSISVADGALFINGKYASEPYILEAMNYFIERPIRIPEGRFFYLGDNRNVSDDSSLGFIGMGGMSWGQDSMRYLGELDALIGRVVFRYYPYDRLGPVYSYPLTNVLGQ